MDPVVVTAWAMTGGALLIGPAALATEGLPPLPGPAAAAALAVLGFGLTSVAFLVMYTILPRVGATNLSLVTFIAPLSATLIGATALAEPVGAGHVAGMALILTGLAAIDGRVLALLPGRGPRKPVSASTPAPPGRKLLTGRPERRGPRTPLGGRWSNGFGLRFMVTSRTTSFGA